jgi:flagellar protein FliS
MNEDIKIYRQMHISGLNQKELIVLLYTGALRFIDEGRKLIIENSVPGAQEKLDRARNIFVHLLSTLNLEAGGELAGKLSALYAYFIEKITMANVTRQVKELDEIIPLIKDIKEAWEKVDINDENIPASKKVADIRPRHMISTEA